jgi:hypothetical protein
VTARMVTLILPTDVAQAVYELAHEWKEVESYGYFGGGDPRDFTPDPDCSTEAERAAHKAACDAWNRGAGAPVDGAHDERVEGDAVVVSTRAVFGLGVQVRRDPLLAAFCAEMERAAKALTGDLERALAASEESNFAATQALLDAEKARAEATTLRAIVEGRTVPPTLEEAEACGPREYWLAQASGARGELFPFLVRFVHDPHRGPSITVDDGDWVPRDEGLAALGAVRWWPVRDGRPCAWPAVP